jgi:predicted kinase
MLMLHFICGSTCAGKTTYAAKLAKEIGAVTFCIDEWMAALYWQDALQPPDGVWVMERIGRCQMRIWDTAKEIAAHGVPCVLEIGFSHAKARAQFAAYAQELGLPVQLHFIDVPAEERWRRVEKRNADKSGPLGFDVTREMFDFVEAMWEPPGQAEMAALNGLRIG